MFQKIAPILFAFILLGFLAEAPVVAQTTGFTYQGKLTDGAATANANYDFEFKLYSVSTGGSSLGTQTQLAVPVTNGIFTVQLDFGTQFDGATRYLEIGVKPAGSVAAYTVLAPRQPITAAPYAIRSLVAATATNATQLGGVPAAQFVQTDASGNVSVTGNLSVGGTFSPNIVNAQTEFQIGGQRVLSATGNNHFSGLFAGQLNTTGVNNSFFGFEAGRNSNGSDNSFFGSAAGKTNTTGGNNSFFGVAAGLSNNNGLDNSFFGRSAGRFNVSGNNNSFFGVDAGRSTTIGSHNSFFGHGSGTLNTLGFENAFFGEDTGSSNTNGSSNAFFGNAAGEANLTGSSNTFIGKNAGNVNTTGGNNTAIGANSDVGASNFSFATAIGAGAVVNASYDSSFQILATCSSSLRYKNNVQTFASGLNIVRRLRPITFTWKNGGGSDVGFGAEEVDEIEPLLTTRNKQGEIEGVKYAQISTVLVNAVKEQQSQIEAQQKQLQQQQLMIDGLKKLACQANPQADICLQGKN